MKPIRFFLAAFSVSLLFSCQQETLEPEEEIVSPVTGEGSEEGLVKLEFSAALEDESRTWLDGTAVKWRGTDKIAVIDNTSPYVHVFDNTDVDGGARCRFVGEAGDAASWTVVYPPSAFERRANNAFYVDIPYEQKAVLNSFADGAYLTVWRGSNKKFTMSPLCSIIKLTLAYDNIKEVEVAGYSSTTLTGTLRPLAGRYRMNDITSPLSNLVWYTSGSEDGPRYPVRLVKPDDKDHIPAGTYYLTLAPFGGEGSSLSTVKNIRITFTRTDDKTASRSITSAKGGEGFAFNRGEYTDFGTVDEGLSWEYYDIVFAVPGLDDHTTATNLRWPFASWQTKDGGSSWTEKADPSANLQDLRSSLAWDIEGKLKDSGHTLRLHSVEAGGTGTKTEKLRYAENANGLYLSGHVGSYIEFPAMPNRHLLRVIVDYDGTSTEGGSPYMKGYSAAACPHITTTAGVEADYTLTRDADGFFHDYNLYSTADNTAYRYVISHDLGTDWSGPRIQRIRLYYSKENRSLTLPEPTLSVISTTLRRHENTLTLTGADGAYDMGIVVRHALEDADPDAPEGHSYDRVIPVPVTPTVVGTTQTYVWENSLPWSKMRDEGELYGGDPGLTEENEVYAYVRKFGCTTDPRRMAPGNSGEGWRTSALTHIDRPDYDWSGTSSDLNYVYSSDRQVKLSATFTVTAGATQAYDYGFIYKTAAAADTPANWNYTKLDQNGTEKENITGYTLASGASQNISATLTGLTPGETYVYRPIVVQHMACKFDDGTSGESSETKDYKYVARASTGSQVTLAGPEVTVHTGDHTPTSAYYTEAEKGQVTPMHINISHLDPDLYTDEAKFTTGIMYYSTNLSSGARQYYRTRYDRKTIGTGTFTNGVWSNVNVYGSNARFLKNGTPLDQTGYLTVADVDGEVVHYRPYFAFLDGGTEGSMDDPGTEGYKYVMASDWGTFTCPVVSASGGDYLWRGATTADLKGTIGIDANGANCKMEIGYSTGNGNTWTTAEDNITTTGEKTISSATLAAEGPQTVKFGVRRHGSSDASTWKSLDIELAHPFSMVTTYSSSWYDNRTTATIAGSFTTNKVASNNLVEYGFYYKDISENVYTSTIYTAPLEAQDYYTINITEGVSTAVTRDKRLVGWFFARLAGSTSVPTSHWTQLYSARSGKQTMTHTWDASLGYAKRLYVNFNTNPRDLNSSPTNPFLPMHDSDHYIDDLSITYANLCQDLKARVVGGLDIEFHMTHGASSTSQTGSDITPSGVCRNADSGHGRMRVYAATKDDYILLPCPSGVKIARFCAWMWGLNQTPYTSASKILYAFLTTNNDNPGYVTGSYQSLTSFTDDMGNWTESLNETNYPYSTYQGLPLRLHFCGESVTRGPNYGDIDTPPDRTELQIPGFWIDYYAPAP